MEQLKTFALMLVFCAAAGLIYYLLLPSGRISETAKGVLSAVTLFCVLLPLFSFLGMEPPTVAPREETAVSDRAAGLLLESVKQRISQTAREAVREFTDLPCEIYVEAHITEDHGIDIELVRLTFDRDFPERAALTQALTERLGFAPTVEIREGE